MTEYDITELIELSSLGTPAARALRARTPRWAAEAAVRRDEQIRAGQAAGLPAPWWYLDEARAAELANLANGPRRDGGG